MWIMEKNIIIADIGFGTFDPYGVVNREKVLEESINNLGMILKIFVLRLIISECILRFFGQKFSRKIMSNWMNTVFT